MDHELNIDAKENMIATMWRVGLISTDKFNNILDYFCDRRSQIDIILARMRGDG